MGGHPDPEIGGPGLKNFFPALWASVWFKNKGRPRPPGSLFWIRHCSRPKQELINLLLPWSQEKWHSSCRIDYFTVVLLLLTLAFNECEAARAVTVKPGQAYPQEPINEFIIQKLNPLLVVDFRLISAFLNV